MTDPLRTDIEAALNLWSAENGSNTPDFILADFLMTCLQAFDRASVQREEWHKPAEHVVSDTEDCWCEPTVVTVAGVGDLRDDRTGYSIDDDRADYEYADCTCGHDYSAHDSKGCFPECGCVDPGPYLNPDHVAARMLWEDGVRQAITWLRADYPYGDGPDWREHGAEWVAHHLAEWRRSNAEADALNEDGWVCPTCGATEHGQCVEVVQ